MAKEDDIVSCKNQTILYKLEALLVAMQQNATDVKILDSRSLTLDVTLIDKDGMYLYVSFNLYTCMHDIYICILQFVYTYVNQSLEEFL